MELSPEDKQLSPLASERWQALTSHDALGERLAVLRKNPDQDIKPLAGVITLAGNPYLIAITPVLNSLYQGPVSRLDDLGATDRSFPPAINKYWQLTH